MGGLLQGAVGVSVAAAALALAGCGGSTAARQQTTTNHQYYSNVTPNTPTPVGTSQAFTAARPYHDPCSLVTLEEVRTIVGQAVKATASNTGSACNYTTGNGLKVYTVAVPPVGDPHTAFNVFKRNSQPVSGVGDQAYCSAPARVVTLYILKGSHLLEVTGTDCAIDQQLAQKVLTRA